MLQPRSRSQQLSLRSKIRLRHAQPLLDLLLETVKLLAPYGDACAGDVAYRTCLQTGARSGRT